MTQSPPNLPALKLMVSEKHTPAEWSAHALARSNAIFDPQPVDDIMERPPKPPKPPKLPKRNPAPGPTQKPSAPGQVRAFDPDLIAAVAAALGSPYQPTSELSNRYFLGVPKAPPFRIDPAEFLARAKLNRPEEPQATASAFAQWVYSLYGRPGSQGDLELGKQAEPRIFEERPRSLAARSIMGACDHEHLVRYRPAWDLVHCGLALEPSDAPTPFFEAPELSVRGRALGASPDLLYRNRDTGDVIIVEVKLSKQPLPSNLWPNVWAQLWCYANLPAVLDAPRVTVIGEIWGELYKWSSSHRASVHWLGLRASVRRDPRQPAYDRFFRSLFDIYRS